MLFFASYDRSLSILSTLITLRRTASEILGYGEFGFFLRQTYVCGPLDYLDGRYITNLNYLMSYLKSNSYAR